MIQNIHLDHGPSLELVQKCLDEGFDSVMIDASEKPFEENVEISAKAVEMARAYAPFVRKIEVEVENLEMLQEALDAKADIIMLDNMTDEMTAQAVAMAKGKAELEASGNMSIERLKKLAEIGVDYISCGALTHSAPILDFSMKNLTPIK